MPDNDTADCDPVKGYLDLQKVNSEAAMAIGEQLVREAIAGNRLHNNCRAGGEWALSVIFLEGGRVLLSPLPLTEALRYARRVLR